MQQNKRQAIRTHHIAVISRSNKSRVAPYCTRKRMYENLSATKHNHCGTRHVGEIFILVQEHILILINETILSLLVTLCSVVSVHKVIHFTFSSIQIS
jgi:hypothetical protein